MTQQQQQRKFKSSEDVDKYVQLLLHLSKDPTDDEIKSFWPSIARLYLSTNDDTSGKAFKFASEYLAKFPNDTDCNVLAAEILQKTEQYEESLVYYHTILCQKSNIGDIHRKYALTCLEICRKPLDVDQRIDFVSKGLLALKKELLWNDVYAIATLDLFKDLLEILLQSLNEQYSTELVDIILENVLNDLYLRDELNSNPKLHALIMNMYVKLKKYKFAWDNALERCMVFLNVYDWNEQVLKNLSVLCDNLSYIDAEDFLFFGDNVLRLSIESNQLLEIVKQLLDVHQQLLDDSDFQAKNLIKDKKRMYFVLREEYLARFYYYYAVYYMKQLKLPLQADKTARHQVQKIISSLQLSLSYIPDAEIDTILDCITYYRVSVAIRLFQSILSCYNYQWTTGNDIVPFKLSPFKRETEKSIHFRLFSPDELVFGSEQLPEPVANDLLRCKQFSAIDVKHIDFDPWNLSKFIYMTSHTIPLGDMRAVLRKIFPKIPETSPVFLSTDPSDSKLCFNLTCADLELFLLQIAMSRHAEVVNQFQLNTFGQVLFLSHHSFWQVKDEQQRFWNSCLVLHGSPSLLQRAYYERSVDSEQFLSDCLREIRSLTLAGPKQKDFYYVLAKALRDLTVEWHIDRSVEFINVSNALKTLAVKSNEKNQNSILFDGYDFTKILVGFDVKSSFKSWCQDVVKLDESRYQKYLALYGNQFSMRQNSLRKDMMDAEDLVEDESSVEIIKDGEDGDFEGFMMNNEVSMIQDRPSRRYRLDRQLDLLKDLKEKSLKYESPVKNTSVSTANLSRLLAADGGDSFEIKSFNEIMKLEHQRENDGNKSNISFTARRTSPVRRGGSGNESFAFKKTKEGIDFKSSTPLKHSSQRLARQMAALEELKRSS